MHKDRGSIKWSSLMLPEHVEILKDVWQQDSYEEAPILDEQQVEANSFAIQEALENQAFIEVTYYEAGAFHTETLQVMYVQPKEGSVRFRDANDTRKTIQLKHITQIKS